MQQRANALKKCVPITACTEGTWRVKFLKKGQISGMHAKAESA